MKGTLPREVILARVQDRFAELRSWHELELAQGRGRAGRVVVRFVLSPSGGVTSALVANSTIGSSRMEQCVAHAVQRILFPPPSGGGVVVVTYSLEFEAAPGGRSRDRVCARRLGRRSATACRCPRSVHDGIFRCIR